MSVSLGRALDDPDRPTLMNGDYSIRPSHEMEELVVFGFGGRRSDGTLSVEKC
jgi:hypothetical protein